MLKFIKCERIGDVRNYTVRNVGKGAVIIPQDINYWKGTEIKTKREVQRKAQSRITKT